MQTNKYVIHALIKTLSPLHIASPGNMRLNTDTMQVVYGDSGGVPCTGVQKLAVQSENGRVVNVPVIASNNIAGRLRRHAAAKVLDVLAAKGERVTIQTYSALTCGAVTGKPDGRDVTFEEYRETRAHPYIGLFGGGPRMMRRYVRVMNAVPYMDATRSMFERVRHPYLDDEAHFVSPENNRRLLGHWIFNRNDDLRDLVNLDLAKKAIQNFDEEINQRQAAILADKKVGDDGQKSSSRHSTKTFSSLEFVVPGVFFPITFELDVTDAQLGLFLISLDSFAQKERLGGHSRNGFGQFSFSSVVISDDQGQVLTKTAFNNSQLVREDVFVAGKFQAWLEAADQLNAADLNRLFAPPEEVADKKGKKAKAGD